MKLSKQFLREMAQPYKSTPGLSLLSLDQVIEEMAATYFTFEQMCKVLACTAEQVKTGNKCSSKAEYIFL